LGPVLDDSIFRTLVQDKPQLSQTFYRRLSDFAELPEPPIRTAGRHETGEVISVPEGGRFLTAARVLLGGDKAAPEHDFFSKINLGYREENPAVEGEVSARQLLSRPPLFEFPAYLDAAHKNSTAEVSFAVEPSGNVHDVEIMVSSGNLELDSLWMRYVRGWQFAPVPEPRNQTGSVKLRFEVSEKSG
jgi:TonB family protein